METNQAKKLLQQLREDYLSELPSICDDIENLVLALALSYKDSFDELYRRVHSMKGSAGTHGLAIISAICHDFEDSLNQLDEGGKVKTELTEVLLRYVDLIRKARSIALSGNDFSEAEEELEKIRQESLHDQHPALLVEATGYVKLLCKEALNALPVQLTTEEDGLLALGRLMRTRFEFVIVANEAKTLNGMALISAIRASDSVNRKIKTILLTSRESLKSDRAESPDYVINRNTDLAEKLPEVAREIISKIKLA